MRKLVIFCIVLGCIYSGYWFAAATGLETGAKTWLADRRSENWVADADVNVTGFPFTFETTMTGVQLADPDTGLAWTAPVFEVQAQSYSPSYITAIFADQQMLASPDEKLTLTSDDMVASVGFVPNTSLALDTSSLAIANLRVTSSKGWTSRFDTGQFMTTQSDAVPFGHHVDADLQGLVMDRALRRQLDPAGFLPEQIETMQLDMTVGFDAAWNRFAIEQARPQPTSIDLDLIRANWGELELLATGQLTIDTQGIPQGRIDVKARNWRDILGIAVQAGFVPDDIAPTVENALELLAGLSGNPNTLDVPLSFQNGNILFGPVPIGPAPRIRIR
ncbi:DUF2125 domain-containing protein [Parasulfitobacter algicola]|uniref:DUF2125 domain-containing protein n=1 Tax=Parasulfitobacter algicola TaxID=2614809 RepID=A0ABX2IR57_9RHOB|nr:DUF2125 domain-containing protein [Sulfitobacter algicola]NSX54830.1 DUF2125 domain-containing protein [Sulfitobacter algicola]